ncbi:hypothetical protein LMG7974_01946 [Campylobacter majalis]|uniref:Uncharacterized protein n=1 Tax=Campylobacter majalis TaxID=2790656 RepID=A0ABM8QAQ9_9BACT|nr:hypothetical protein LMG7974_01946 [Campylobacter majalis]
MLGGAYGIIKSAKKLDKVDGEFVKSGNEISTSKIKDKDSAVNVANYEK